MANAIRVNSQNPSRTIALEPIRCRLHHAACDEVVTLAMIIGVLIVSRDDHASPELHGFPLVVQARIRMREAEDLAEEPVKISAKSVHRAKLIAR
jgi:hypothetical protein